MADEELHETDSNNQKDWQSETSSSTVADETASKDTEQNAENASAEEGAAYGVNMEQRMMNRQAENTKRVEETIKGTKSNPRWFVPLFCAFMIIGLIWCVVYYLSPSGSWPIPNIGAWNLGIGFALIMIGFLMTMGWR